MLKLQKFAPLYFSRLSSTLSANQVLENLPKRTLIRVCGADSSNFLQGLITNDIEHLNSGPGSMYSMFLNTAGRVLYDVIIYRNLEKDTFLIECDSRVSDKLQKHLKLYRVRRKIDVVNIGDEFKVYALFNNNQKKFIDNDKMQFSDGNIAPCQELNKSQPTRSFKTHQDILIYRDPRIFELGSRIIARADVKLEEALSDIIKIAITNPSERNYRWICYNLGVGEGIEDLPPGECFPLESNCDYLHGVSFHKGCYIGQELTARVHHTGVVRKRLMPIYFTKIPSKLPDEKITQEKVNLGKLRGIEKDVGLASLRIDKALNFKEIQIGDGIAVTSKPHWWPLEAPKEKINIVKV